MYYPYFRGKQYELITIRENIQILKDSNFSPIIEPVKESLGGLTKTISSIVDANASATIIINLHHGDHSNNTEKIISLLQEDLITDSNISAGILLSENTSLHLAREFFNTFSDRSVTFIHAGFTEAKLLVEEIGDEITSVNHVFLEAKCGKLYQRHFKDSNRILLRDGFQKRINREHPPVEFFSDLHATFEDEGMNGFGDFLIVGDDYSESGGPAYAIAIHLTFIDSNKDDGMYVHHFKSIRQDDPKDPAGKFSEALDKLIKEVEEPTTNILKTDAVSEFIDLHNRGHFPGLGYVKKLSMKHHIETLSNYFNNI